MDNDLVDSAGKAENKNNKMTRQLKKNKAGTVSFPYRDGKRKADEGEYAQSINQLYNLQKRPKVSTYNSWLMEWTLPCIDVEALLPWPGKFMIFIHGTLDDHDSSVVEVLLWPTLEERGDVVGAVTELMVLSSGKGCFLGMSRHRDTERNTDKLNMEDSMKAQHK